ncbi:MAG: DivIVA domain-containing protein [Bifidobacterium psychraerophilum]
MAQEPDAEKRGSVIARAGKRKWGYDTGQVDAFLERAHALYESDEPRLGQDDIQNVSFELKKNGYVISQVDATLARLERAVVDKRTTWELNEHGRVAWRAETESMFRRYSEHASRLLGERFKEGEPKRPSYKRKQVDRLIDQISRKLSVDLNQDHDSEDAKDLVDLNAKRVSNVIFTQSRGKRGYDERQVDYFLNFAIQLLSRVESYIRVNDYTPADDEARQHLAADTSAEATSFIPSQSSLNNGETQVVAPLFDMAGRNNGHSQEEHPQGFAPEHAEEATMAFGQPVQETPAADEKDSVDDFNRLNAAEKAIFQASGASGAAGAASGVAGVAASGAAPASAEAEAPAAHQNMQPASSNASLAALAQVHHDHSEPAPSQSSPSQEAATQAVSNESAALPSGYGQDAQATQVNQSAAAAPKGDAIAAAAQQRFEVEDAATEQFDPLSFNEAQPRSWKPEQPATGTRQAAPSPSSDNGQQSASTPVNPFALSSQAQPAQESPSRGAAPQNSWSAQTGRQDAQQSAPAQVFPSQAADASAASRPQTGDAAAQGAGQSTPVPDKREDPDQYLAQLTSLLDSSTFPKVDLDIPDLSFPSFDNDESDAPKRSGQSSATDKPAE